MLRAVSLMFIAMSMIPAGDLCGKLLTSAGSATPAFVAWSRFALGALMVLPFAPIRAFGLLRDRRVWLRALLLTGGIFSIQMALRSAPMADVFAAFFIGPIISYTLSALFLKEQISWARTLLMALGFGGVLLVVRPGFGGAPELLWAVLAGCFYGGFLTTGRWLRDLGSPLELSLTQLVLSALFLTPLGVTQLPDFDWSTVGLTLGSAGFSMLGNMILLVAYAQSEASRLAPLVYLQLISAVSLGWVFFDQWPDAVTWGGLAVVVGAGLWSALLRR